MMFGVAGQTSCDSGQKRHKGKKYEIGIHKRLVLVDLSVTSKGF
jgi:hypothetical protein